MASDIARATEILRTTVVQEARVVLEPCIDSRVRVRRVQLLIPSSPMVYVGLDVTPDELGPNRTYKLPVMPVGATIELLLGPEQFIVAAADEQFAFLGLVVEYLR